MVRRELGGLPKEQRDEFFEEYRRKRKLMWLAYLLWIPGLHYAYFRRWGLLILFILTAGGFLIWWLIDAYRVHGIVRNHNKDAAVEALANLRRVAADMPRRPP